MRRQPQRGDEYVELRRFAVAVAESLDRALGLSLFEPAAEERADDLGIVLVELLADVANALSDYEGRVAAEARLRTRRRVVTAAALLVAFAWLRRRRR